MLFSNYCYNCFFYTHRISNIWVTLFSLISYTYYLENYRYIEILIFNLRNINYERAQNLILHQLHTLYIKIFIIYFGNTCILKIFLKP